MFAAILLRIYFASLQIRYKLSPKIHLKSQNQHIKIFKDFIVWEGGFWNIFMMYR